MIRPAGIRRRALASVLALVNARDGAPELAGELDPALTGAVVEVARMHGVEAWLAATVPAPPPGLAAWAGQRTRFVAACADARRTARAFGTVAAQVGADWAVLKGAAVAEDLYPKVAMRFGVDVDVLVSPLRFAGVVRALEDAGWLLLDQNWPLLAAARPAELKFLAPTGQLVDLHWHLVADQRHRRGLRLPTDDLLAARRQLPSGLPALGRADQLLHLALHAAHSGANRLMWLLDSSLASGSVEWFDACDRAVRSGAAPAVVLTLLRARRWLPAFPAAGLTDRQLDAAAGPSWRRLCERVDALTGLAPDPRRPAVGRSFAVCAGPGVVASLREFGRHGVAYLHGGAPRGRDDVWFSDATDPRSALYPVSDPAARAAYFDAVSG